MKTETLKNIIKAELPSIKFSLKYIKKGSMKDTFIMSVRKNKSTGQYEGYTEFEQNNIIKAFNKIGFFNYDGEPFPRESWRYFNGGMSVYFKC